MVKQEPPPAAPFAPGRRVRYTGPPLRLPGRGVSGGLQTGDVGTCRGVLADGPLQCLVLFPSGFVAAVAAGDPFFQEASRADGRDESH